MAERPTTKDEYRRRINRLTEYINDHLGEQIDVGMLASESGFSMWHFHRITRAFLGEPLWAYIVRMRLENAARLLRHSELTVSEIAYRVGYDVPSSLSKAFRQTYGISPSQYRKSKNFSIMRPMQVNPDLDISMEVRHVEDCDIIYIRLTGAYGTLDYPGTWRRLWPYLLENGITDWCPDFICVFYDDPKVTEPSRLRTDVCFTTPRPLPEKGEIGSRTLRGDKYAVFSYTGPYANLGSVYDTIYSKLIPEAGLTIKDDPGYEKYVNNPEETTPEKYLTQIYIPIE